MESPNLPDRKPIDEFLNSFGEFESGFPKYRLVWSDDLLERRFSDYSDFDSSNNFLRTEKNVIRLTPKYVVFKSRWVFEKAVPNPVPEEIEGKIVYEPVWVFHDRHGNYIGPSLGAIKFLMWFILNPDHVFTPADFKEQERIEFEKEAEEFLEIMKNEQPDLAIALKDGSAVFISGENK